MLAQPKNAKLTARQQHLLDFIQYFTTQHQYGPTIREIVAGTDFSSTSVVSYNLDKLVRAGYLERDPKVARGLRVLCDTNSNLDMMARVPLLRRVLTLPTSPLPKTGHVVQVPNHWLAAVDPTECYAVRITADLFVEADVLEGHTVVLRRQYTPQAGQVVLLACDNETALHIVKIERLGERLQVLPIFGSGERQTIPNAQVNVLGHVLGLMRRF